MSHAIWIAAAALVVLPTRLHAEGGACDAVPLEQLKSSYLVCDQVMSRQRVEPLLAQRCAEIGEALKQRAFDGDFERLIAWWRRERDGPAARRLQVEAPWPSCRAG